MMQGLMSAMQSGSAFDQRLRDAAPLLAVMGGDFSRGTPGANTAQGLAAMMQMQERRKAKQEEEEQRAQQGIERARALATAGVPLDQGAIIQQMEAAKPGSGMGALFEQRYGQQGEQDPFARYRVVGGALVDLANPDGPKPVYQQPDEADQPTTQFRALHERATAAGLQPGSPQYNDFIINGGVQRTEDVSPSFRVLSREEAEAAGVPFGSQVDERTNRIYPAQSRDQTSEGERKAAGFFTRMTEAERIIQRLEDEGVTAPSFGERALGMVLPEDMALGPQSEMLRQAQRDWVRAKLRFESGALIGDEEADEEIRTYFPQPWEGPEVIAQKAQARRVAMDAMRAAAGREAGQQPQGQGAPQGSVAPQLPPNAQPWTPNSQYVQGQIAVNPQTGERRQWNGSAWVPVE